MEADPPKKSNQIWSWFLILLMLVGGYFVYNNYFKNPCHVPVKYAIGNIDPRFKISSSDVLNVAEDASNRWNRNLNEPVLVYDPNATLKINLVYDERQKKIDEIAAEMGTLDSSGNSIDSLRSKLQNLLDEYNKDLNSYNSEVSYWNARGGAPSDVYARLQKEKADLDSRRVSINNSVSILNAQVDEHNSNLEDLNSQIDADKNKIITQGEYTSNPLGIDIFTFGNKDELRLVIMHELGHALSLDHDTMKQSIMFPILGDQDLSNPMPSNEDAQMFKSTCKSADHLWSRILNIFNKPTVSTQ